MKKPTSKLPVLELSGQVAALYFPLPEEQSAFDDARLGSALRCAMSNFYNSSLRARLKHGDFSQLENQLLETIKREFFEAINEYEAGDVA